jgi:hypothetical protein
VPGGVDHVVHQQAGLAAHVADDVHHLRLVGARAALVDDREVGVVQPLGQRAGAHHAADVGRDHDHVLVALFPGVVQQHRRGVDVVHRDVEKPWIWSACRSTVSTRSTPACVIMLATSLAEIATRWARGRRSWRA